MVNRANGLGFRNDIVGLRGIAVMAVLGYHAFPEYFPQGYLGVDLFFVISGFVITRKLFTECLDSVFSYKQFVLSRIRRLFPALFVVLLLTYLVGFWLLTPSDLRELSQGILSNLTVMQNIYLYRETDYFGASLAVLPLLHTWSLGVEEQFYLIFPLIFSILFRKIWLLAFTLVVALALSYASALILETSMQRAVFYLLPFRAWQLLAGSLCLILYYTLKRHTFAYSSLVRYCAYLSIFVCILAPQGLQLSNYFTNSICVAAGALLLLTHPNTKIELLLVNNRLINLLGMSSYSTYLVHQPLLEFARIYFKHDISDMSLILLVCVSVGFGVTLWKLVELPFRYRRNWSNLSIFKTSIVCGLCLAFLSFLTILTSGFSSIYYGNRLDAEEKIIYNLIERHTMKDISKRMPSSKCRFNTLQLSQFTQERFEECYKEKGKALVVVGDSHAISIFNILYESQRVPFLFGFVSGGCRPYPDLESCDFPEKLSFLKYNQDKIHSVIYHQSGSYFLLDEVGRPDSFASFLKDAPLIIDSDGIKATIDFLEELGSFARTKWLGPYAEARIDFRNVRNWRTREIEAHILQRFRSLDQEIEMAFNDHEWDRSSTTYLSLTQDFAIRPQDVWINSCLIWNDADHFTECGERILLERIGDNISEWFGANSRNTKLANQPHPSGNLMQTELRTRCSPMRCD